MALAEDLLEQAYHLARRDRTRPKQASLRRAVSTAYYALFHLLIREAVSNWKRDDHRAELARAFDHGPMRKASDSFAKGKFPNQSPLAVADLKQVAGTFVRLYELRGLADYDNAERWTRTDALKAIDRVSAAFGAWRAVRTEKIAQDYLFRLLVTRR